MDKATKAKIWHDKNDKICRNCKHWRNETVFGDPFNYCGFQHFGEVVLGRTGDESCSRWEAKDEAGQS